ncbi:MAG: redoxin family protein [Phycisphaerales bacterium]|nr:redoxin family protein [Phycisphaerales bacterium]
MKSIITLTLSGLTIFSLVGCETPQTTAETDAATPPAPASLAIGDNAPAISIDHWVKGDSFETFEDGQVYVMEFWATWCGHCISSMPHLSSLQDKYGDTVKFTGVSSEKELKTVTEFLTQTNKKDEKLNWDRMRYTVAVDPDRSTSKVYMEAAGQNGIPTAFIVDANGKVAWIGHPMNMDEPLAEIVEGSWDLTAAAEEFKKAAIQKNAMRELRSTYRTAMENQDWDGWIASIDNFVSQFGENPQLASMKFDALLTGKKDKGAAYEWAETMIQSDWDNPTALNSIAWGIVDETPAELQNLDFALRVALRASELTDNKDSMILDTVARCYWEQGETYKAIAWQEKAVEHAEGGPMSDSIRATLDEYQATVANVDE